ncbi:hypothetical protein HPP92_017013 [Vanilla planifolia]|uniref:Senescence regulator n=1 Tax=Vanilla planifolia TaxID=51239 RepID=A0A835QRE5_VANPL|nr:hypothetical protein HPP92_017013 [Vanilla planifolia]
MDEDFGEEEVWAMVREGRDHSPNDTKKKGSTVVRSKGHGEGSSRGAVLRQSSPVHIPDWSKIYRQSTSSTTAGGEQGDSTGLMVEEEDEEWEERVPPHEWITRKLARSQISCFSVCEGAGRTLKGRDQRKVRNAVLTKTGFLE